MSVNEWIREIEKANNERNLNIISKANYEDRIKNAIAMIYKEGDKDRAKGIAKAHGYKMKDLL